LNAITSETARLELVTITDPVTWILWSFCLVVAVLCLRPPKSEYGNLRYLSPRLFFGIAFLLLNVFSPLSIMVTGNTYRGFIFLDEINLMLLASILAGGAFLVGWRWSSTRTQTQPGSASVAFSPRQQIARALLLSPLILLTVIGFMRGLPQTEWLTVYNFARASLVAIDSLLVLAALKVQRLISRIGLLVIGVAVTALYTWLVLQQSARLFLLLLLVPAGALWLYGSRRAGVLVGLVVAVFFAWFFVFFGNARYLIFYGQQNQPLESLLEIAAPQGPQDVYERLYVAGDLDAFENGTLVMRLIPAVADYYYGATFVTLFVLPIPRAWWPDKPAASVNYLLADSFGFYSDNFAISLVAEAYANFSWPGVVLFFLLFGFLSERMYAAAVRERDNPENWVHLGFYCAYIILVMRGSFQSMTSYYLMVVVWMVVSAWTVQLVRRPGRGPYRESISQ
jgi:oligosaccharide repeat unit polymerase